MLRRSWLKTRDELVLKVDVANLVEARSIIHIDQQLDLVHDRARAALLLLDD